MQYSNSCSAVGTAAQSLPAHPPACTQTQSHQPGHTSEENQACHTPHQHIPPRPAAAVKHKVSESSPPTALSLRNLSGGTSQPWAPPPAAPATAQPSTRCWQDLLHKALGPKAQEQLSPHPRTTSAVLSNTHTQRHTYHMCLYLHLSNNTQSWCLRNLACFKHQHLS